MFHKGVPPLGESRATRRALASDPRLLVARATAGVLRERWLQGGASAHPAVAPTRASAGTALARGWLQRWPSAWSTLELALLQRGRPLLAPAPCHRWLPGSTQRWPRAGGLGHGASPGPALAPWASQPALLGQRWLDHHPASAGGQRWPTAIQPAPAQRWLPDHRASAGPALARARYL